MKRWTIDWLKETGEIILRIFKYFVEKTYGIKKDKERWSSLLVAVLVASVFTGGAFGGAFGSAFKYVPIAIEFLTGEKADIKPNSALASPTFAVAPRSGAFSLSANTTNCDLSGPWKLWKGDKLSTDIEDRTLYTLPQKKSRALLNYNGTVKDMRICEFEFIPRGANAINYVISLDGVFQIVIGDNDYATIALRASDYLDGPLYPVKESKTDKTRPRLLSSVKEGSLIKILLEQNLTPDGQYSVQATIQYEADTQENVPRTPETFSWQFKPSPALRIYGLDLSVGLIRATGDDSEVAANFISPNPSLDQ